MTLTTGLEIVLVEGEHRIDSRLVAGSLGIEHKHFMETLRTYQAELEELGILPFETAEIRGRGQPQKYGMLNENQAIFAATLSRNTRQVVDFKLKLTKAFSEARKHVPLSSTSAIHTLTDALRPRALENMRNVPEGYFSVMGELFKHLYNLESIINQALDENAGIEISVGQHWSTYARDVLNIPDQQRCKYRHRCQDDHTVGAWAYSIQYVNTFAKWLWQVYFPENFAAYQRYRSRRIALPAPKQQKRIG